MRLFKCQRCGERLYFENRVCGNCGCRLGYLPDRTVLSALESDELGSWGALAVPEKSYRFCTNAEYDVCNWLIEVSSPENFCVACRHNRTVPDTNDPQTLLLWQKIERAKHRLFYTLSRLRLPLVTRLEDPAQGLAFDFLKQPIQGPKVMTGHDDGVITLAVDEADDAVRESLRTEMGETYRTLLGHFRHEIGHYFWDKLVRDGNCIDAYRQVFGDESRDYGQALKEHYAHGPPANWEESFISAYATSHPWEDFAETWAHYLHIMDTLETASSYGLRIHPPNQTNSELDAEIDFDPHDTDDLDRVVKAWLPLTFAVNSLNRSMGQSDFYPFVLSPAIISKLSFIHDLVQRDRIH